MTGNQEKKYLRFLRGEVTQLHPEVQKTADAVAAQGSEFVKEVHAFLESLPFKYETDRLIVVHGASREDVDEKKAEELALYGETDGTLDKRGQKVRLDKWETDYRGTKTIVHGHTALREVTRRDLPSGARIFNIDTKAAFGGKLTALRFPRLQIVQVPSRAAYVKDWDA